LLFVFIIAIIFVIQLDPALKIFVIIGIITTSLWCFVLMDEYRSDSFASMILRDKYGISKPSKILEKTLEKMPQSLLSTLTHPSVQQRVKNIAVTVDQN